MHAATKQQTENAHHVWSNGVHLQQPSAHHASCVFMHHAQHDVTTCYNIIYVLVSRSVVQYHMLCRIYRSIYTYTHTKY